MSIEQVFQSLGERLQSAASVKSVYGEPVTADGRTVIPVARVAYGFGGGVGTGRRDATEKSARKAAAPGDGDHSELLGEGGGGGGGVVAHPIGVVEISPAGTRFIRFNQAPLLTGVAVGAVLFGLLLGRLRRR